MVRFDCSGGLCPLKTVIIERRYSKNILKQCHHRDFVRRDFVSKV